MKIEKLMTLSQFVEYVMKERPYATADGNDMSELADNMVAVYDYNRFLSRQLTKDMFVCEKEKPINNFNAGVPPEYIYDLEEYEQAQKKVIFENCESHIDSVIVNNEYSIPFYVGGNKRIAHTTLLDLANATNGELKLKNVDI